MNRRISEQIEKYIQLSMQSIMLIRLDVEMEKLVRIRMDRLQSFLRAVQGSFPVLVEKVYAVLPGFFEALRLDEARPPRAELWTCGVAFIDAAFRNSPLR